jgi:hypothetical protein
LGAAIILKDHEAVDQLGRIIITHELPTSDFTLYNIRCPYCGKPDRIRELESPDDLNSRLNSQDLTMYSEIWQQFTGSDESLGVCKFCNNPVKLKNNNSAQPLY